MIPIYFYFNCLVNGAGEPAGPVGGSHIFPVKLSKTESADTLNKAIEEEKKLPFDHLAADTLVLWKVSVPEHE